MVVAAGLSVTGVPEVTGPKPGWIDPAPPLNVKESVTDPPANTSAGAALNEAIEGAAKAVTSARAVIDGSCFDAASTWYVPGCVGAV